MEAVGLGKGAYCLGLLYLYFCGMTWAYELCSLVVHLMWLSSLSLLSGSLVLTSLLLKLGLFQIRYEELVGQSFRYLVFILDWKAGSDSSSVVTKKVCEWDKWLDLPGRVTSWTTGTIPKSVRRAQVKWNLEPSPGQHTDCATGAKPGGLGREQVSKVLGIQKAGWVSDSG